MDFHRKWPSGEIPRFSVKSRPEVLISTKYKMIGMMNWSSFLGLCMSKIAIWVGKMPN